MNTRTHERLDWMVAELVGRGLPADYAQRAVAELEDHRRDLVEELQAAGRSKSQALAEALQRLGDGRVLVRNTVRSYQRRFWCGRWPLITFLLAPIPLLVLTWIIFGLVTFCILWPLDKLGLDKIGLIGPHQPDGVISTGEWLANLAMLTLTCFVAPSVTMFALARLAKRAALDWKWLVVSACLLGLGIGMVRCGFPETRLRPTVDGKGVPADQPLLTLGVPLFAPTWRAAWNWYTHDLQQTSQVLLPMIVVAAFALRAKQLSLRARRLVMDGC